MTAAPAASVAPGEPGTPTPVPPTAPPAGGLTEVTLTGPVPVGHPVPPGPLRVTTAVGADVAAVEPSGFVAVTRTRIVFPTSTPRSVYVRAVAPLIAEQLLPLVLQRSHWNA